MTLLEVLKIISRYWPKNYLDYHKVIIFIYNYSKIIVYYTFSDKSTFIEMCNNDGQNIMHTFWCDNYMFRVIYNSKQEITNISIIKPIR